MTDPDTRFAIMTIGFVIILITYLYIKSKWNTSSNKILAVALIILISIIFFSYAEGQTIQDLDRRLTRVEDSLGINNIIVPIDTANSFPVYQGIILTGNYDVYPSPYSPMFKDRDGLYKLFLQKTGLPFAAGSANGLNGWIFSSAGNMPRGSVMKEDPNKYLVIYHKWYNGQ